MGSQFHDLFSMLSQNVIDFCVLSFLLNFFNFCFDVVIIVVVPHSEMLRHYSWLCIQKYCL